MTNSRIIVDTMPRSASQCPFALHEGNGNWICQLGHGDIALCAHDKYRSPTHDDTHQHKSCPWLKSLSGE